MQDDPDHPPLTLVMPVGGGIAMNVEMLNTDISNLLDSRQCMCHYQLKIYFFQPHLTVHNGQADQTGEYTIALQWECFWIAVQYLASLVVNIALKCIVGIENAGWNPGRKCVASDVLPVLHCRHCIAL